MDYTHRQVAVDGFLLALVVLPSIAVHYVAPAEVQAALAVEYGSPSVVTMVTAAFVHHGGAHLWGNVVTYGLVVLPAWVLHLATGRRRQFWWVMGLLLVGAPVLVAAGTATWLAGVAESAPVAGRGFSGVVAGIAGYLLMAIVYHVMTIEDRRVVGTMTAGIVLVVVGSALVVNAGRIVDGLGMGAADGAATAALATGAGTVSVGVRSRLVHPGPVVRWARRNPMEMGAVGTGLPAFVVCFHAAFPTTLGAGPTVNVVGHGVGMTVGVLLATLANRDAF